MEDELAAADVHGVPCVVASLVSRDERKLRGEEVNDFPLALISPLCAEHCDVHDRRPCYYTGRRIDSRARWTKRTAPRRRQSAPPAGYLSGVRHWTRTRPL